MRAFATGFLLCSLLIGKTAWRPTDHAASPAASTPRPLTFEEAELLVLDTTPVLREVADGPVVLGHPQVVLPSAARQGVYWVQVSRPLQGPHHVLGTYRVNSRTAQVFDAHGAELHNRELTIAQRLVREAHGLAVVTLANLQPSQLTPPSPGSAPSRLNKEFKGKWWPGTELNRRHADFQSAALPAELPGHARRRQEPAAP